MAYCGIGPDSDVYFYLGASFEIHYARPDTTGRHGYSTDDPRDALAKLQSLRTEGFLIPQHALDRLSREIAVASRR